MKNNRDKKTDFRALITPPQNVSKADQLNVDFPGKFRKRTLTPGKFIAFGMKYLRENVDASFFLMENRFVTE